MTYTRGWRLCTMVTLKYCTVRLDDLRLHIGSIIERFMIHDVETNPSCTHDIDTNEEKTRGQWMRE